MFREDNCWQDTDDATQVLNCSGRTRTIGRQNTDDTTQVLTGSGRTIGWQDTDDTTQVSNSHENIRPDTRYHIHHMAGWHRNKVLCLASSLTNQLPTHSPRILYRSGNNYLLLWPSKIKQDVYNSDEQCFIHHDDYKQVYVIGKCTIKKNCIKWGKMVKK